MMKWILPSVLLLAVSACVSEGGAPSSNKESAGPVEIVQGRIDDHIDQMSHLSGRDLLRQIQIVIGYKELALEPIFKALPTANPAHRANLLYCLGYIGGIEARAQAVRYLGDADPAVAYEAAASLVTMGDWSGVPKLIQLLGAKNRRLRYKAFQVLKGVAKKDLGYEFAASAPEREEAIGRWKGWWQERRRDMIMGN